MKHITIVLILLFIHISAMPQSTKRMEVKGRIVDKDKHNALSEATINCLDAKDSSRIAIVFTDINGSFSLDKFLPSSFLLYITFLGYQPEILTVNTLNNKTLIDVGTIEMNKSEINLEAIVVNQIRSNVRVAKDTLEFNASHFKPKINGSVEDLLKLIPGIQIDKDGTIRINGQITKTIMVNGKSLFSDDPQIISRNLQADMIDKIQLVDRINERTELRSADSKPDKIINITIKKDKMNTISGELSAAYGTSNSRYSKFNINRFKEKEQLLVIGNGDNINGALESNSLGSGGIQKKRNAGLSFINEITDKTSFNINYLLNNNQTSDIRSSMKQNIINDSILYYKQNSENKTAQTTQSLAIGIDNKIDSLQKFSFLGQLNFSGRSNAISTDFNSQISNFQEVNSGTYISEDKTNTNSQYANLSYEKKFHKKGRVLEISTSIIKGNTTGSQYNKSNSLFSPVKGESKSDSTNQYISTNSNMKQLFIVLNYKEPVLNNGFLVFTIAENRTKSKIERSTYNYNSETDTYGKIIDSLSNSQLSTPSQHLIKVGWSHKKENLDYSLSASTLLYEMSIRSFNSNTAISRSLIKFLPDFNLNFTPANNNKIGFTYRKSADFPTTYQLQSIIDNSDPLILIHGNSELQPTNTHDLSLTYNYINISTLRYLSASFNARITSNQIISANQTDSVGRQIIYLINSRGGYSLNFNIENSIPLKKAHSTIYFNTRGMLNKSANSINGIQGFNRDLSLTQSLRFSFAHDSLYDLNISNMLSYNMVGYSIQNSKMSSFISGGLSLGCTINLPWGLMLETDYSLGWSTGRLKGYNTNPMILNAAISKLLFPNRNGVIKIQGFDLLKQNSSATRNIGINYVEDVKENTLERFFILKFSYFFGRKR